MNILLFNPGSSSLKFSCYRINFNGDNSKDNFSHEELLIDGSIEGIGKKQATLKWKTPRNEDETISTHSISKATKLIFERLIQHFGEKELNELIDVIGIRVVHGGNYFSKPVRITEDVLTKIRSLRDVAPLHNPVDVELIQNLQKLAPHREIVAVFDTAFHHDLPQVAQTYAIPENLIQKYGIRRFGFHGIVYRWVSTRLLNALGRKSERTRLILCHLGNGSSICAVKDGKSVDTSMGFTPLEGLVMSTRCGDIDPGLIFYLQRVLNISPEQLENLFNHESGLLGVSGNLSSDTRELVDAAKRGNKNAQLALELFVYRIAKYIGAYAVVLGGIDTIAFSGGIGENSGLLRARICERLKFLGVSLDQKINENADAKTDTQISTTDSAVSVWIIPANENLQMAKEISVCNH